GPPVALAIPAPPLRARRTLARERRGHPVLDEVDCSAAITSIQTSTRRSIDEQLSSAGTRRGSQRSVERRLRGEVLHEVPPRYSRERVRRRTGECIYPKGRVTMNGRSSLFAAAVLVGCIILAGSASGGVRSRAGGGSFSMFSFSFTLNHLSNLNGDNFQ